MRRKRSRKRVSWGAIALFSILWGLHYPILRYGLNELHPFVFNALRTTLAAGILFGLHLVQGRRPSLRPRLVPRRGAVARVVALGAGALLLFEVLFVLGATRAGAGNAGLLMATVPVFAVLVGWFHLTDPLDLGSWVGIALAGLGTFLLVVFGGHLEFGSGGLSGNLLLLFAALTWAAWSRTWKSDREILPPTTLAAAVVGATLPVHWLLALPHLGSVLDFAPSPLVLGALLYSGLAGTALGWALWKFDGPHTDRLRRDALTALPALVALVSGGLLLGESITPPMAMGGALLLGGLWMVGRFDHLSDDDDGEEPLPERLHTVRIRGGGSSRRSA